MTSRLLALFVLMAWAGSLHAERVLQKKVLVWPSDPRSGLGTDRLVGECLESMGIREWVVGRKRFLDPLEEPLLVVPSRAMDQRELDRERILEYIRHGGVVLDFHGGWKGWVPWGWIHGRRHGRDLSCANWDRAPLSWPYRHWPCDLSHLTDHGTGRPTSWRGSFTHLPDGTVFHALCGQGEALLFEIPYGDGAFLHSSFHVDLLHQMDPQRNWIARRFLVNLLFWAVGKTGVWSPRVPPDLRDPVSVGPRAHPDARGPIWAPRRSGPTP